MRAPSAGGPVNCRELRNVSATFPGGSTPRAYAWLFIEAMNQSCRAGSWTPFPTVTKTGSSQSAGVYSALGVATGFGRPYPTAPRPTSTAFLAYNLVAQTNGLQVLSEGQFRALVEQRTGTFGMTAPAPTPAPMPAPSPAPMPAPSPGVVPGPTVRPILTAPPPDFGPTDGAGNPVTAAPQAEQPERGEFLGPIISTITGGIVGGEKGPCYAAVLPPTASYIELRQASGEGDAAFGLVNPQMNNGANWAYDDGQGWFIETCKDVLGQKVDKGARDVPARGQVQLQFMAGGARPNTPAGPVRPGGPMVPGPEGGPLAACGGVEPMQTTRRTCGRGMILAYDGLCYPKKILPAALRANKSKRAKVTRRDWDTVRKAKQVQRVVERMDRDIESLYKRPARRRRRRTTTTTRKK